MISLRQAEVLRAVMLTGSITGAARLLNVSPPGVSRMIRHLEGATGVRFFLRRAGAFVPTPEARGIFESLESIHHRLQDINRRLSLAGEGRVPRLAIGTSPGLGVSLIPRALAAIRRQYPALRLALDVLHVDEVVPALLTRQVEAAITIYEVDDPRVVAERLAEGRLVCLVPAGSPLAGRTRLSIGDLAAEPLIGYEPTVFQHAMIAGLFEASGRPLDPAIRVRLMSTALTLVQHGLGVALVDAFTVAGEPPPGVRVVPLEEEAVFRLYAVHDLAEPLSVHALQLLEMIRREGATLPG